MPEGIGGVLIHVAYWGSGLAALAIFVGVVLFGFIRKDWRMAGYMVAGSITAIIAAQLLMWIGNHMWLVSMLTIVIGGLTIAIVAYRHRYKLEHQLGIDLNRDGIVGDPEQN